MAVAAATQLRLQLPLNCGRSIAVVAVSSCSCHLVAVAPTQLRLQPYVLPKISGSQPTPLKLRSADDNTQQPNFSMGFLNKNYDPSVASIGPVAP